MQQAPHVERSHKWHSRMQEIEDDERAKVRAQEELKEAMTIEIQETESARTEAAKTSAIAASDKSNTQRQREETETALLILSEATYKNYPCAYYSFIN